MTYQPVQVWIGTGVQVADYPAGATFGPRQLRDYEFVWVLSGSARWRLQVAARPGPLVEHELRPGTLALARPGTIDSYHWDEGQTTTHAYVHFRLEDPGGLPPPADWPAHRSVSSLPMWPAIGDYLHQLAGQPGPAARARSELLLGLLLDLFVTGSLAEVEPLPAPLTAVAEATRAAWGSGLRLLSADELATAVGISTGHLFRVFREHYGCGPARALELIRLARAAVILQRSNATLAEVAHRCGFANAYHFSRRFATAYGRPPGAFRRQPEQVDPYAPIRESGLVSLARALEIT